MIRATSSWSRRIETETSVWGRPRAVVGLLAVIALLAGCQTAPKPLQAARYPQPPIITASSQDDALAAASRMCPAGGYVVRVLRTGSMYPTIDRDCFAVMKVDFAGINEGDICSIKIPAGFNADRSVNQRPVTLIHRVVNRWPIGNETAWETRGDNCLTNLRSDSFPLLRENYAGTALCFVTWKNAGLTYLTGNF